MAVEKKKILKTKKRIQEFAIMSELLALSLKMGSEHTCMVNHFQKVQGEKFKAQFLSISLKTLFILHKFIQIDLNCTPAKNEKKMLRITLKTQSPLTSKLMIGNW